jgi:hypothetical protein
MGGSHEAFRGLLGMLALGGSYPLTAGPTRPFRGIHHPTHGTTASHSNKRARRKAERQNRVRGRR